MKTAALISATCLLFDLTSFGQTTKDLNIDFMLRGHIYARSSLEDSISPGGFAQSDNVAKKIYFSLNYPQSGFFLKVDTTKTATIDKAYNAYKLFIVNKSDSLVKLNASDSRLYVIAEVLYKGEWKPIEYLPSSWCGNSYHHVYLKQDEYWEFNVPVFSGKIKTKLRYRLEIPDGQYIYSNEISTSINAGQMKDKQGHQPQSIMDPYND